MRLLLRITICVLFMAMHRIGYSQDGRSQKQLNDSVTGGYRRYFFSTDSSQWKLDSVPVCTCRLDAGGKNTGFPAKSIVKPKGFVSFDQALISYQFYYQSNVDTPFAERNIQQHNVMAQVNGELFGIFPVLARVWTRQSNSSFYRDISDFQIVYDQGGWQTKAKDIYKQQLSLEEQERKVQRFSTCLSDQLADYHKYKNVFEKGVWHQRLVEAYEILNVPGITYDFSLPDSVNLQRERLQKQQASAYIKWYHAYAAKFGQYENQLDSLSQLKNRQLSRILAYKSILDKPDWQYLMAQNDTLLPSAAFPPWIKWMMGLRNFSIGRSNVNSSELTAKNISVNGLSFEWNKKFYVAGVVGGVDYRFRNLSFGNKRQPFSPFYLLKLGVGDRQGSHVFLSGYSGKKSWPSGLETTNSLRVSGLALEARKNFGKYWWVTGEVAQSVAPNYKTNPLTDQTKIGFGRQGNSAYAVKLVGSSPRLQYRVEGAFRKSGENFQSFSTWQMNTALSNWSVKWDQAFWKRRLRLQVSARTNQWENSFLPQAYTTSSIIKSGQLVFQQRKLPAISIGYIPVSQLAKLGEVITETRYQMFTTNIWYTYRLANTGMSSSFNYLRSFDGYDSLRQYQNSRNLQLSHSVFFKLFTSSLHVMFAETPYYDYSVWDHRIQIPFFRQKTVIGFGTKIYHYNRNEERLGLSLNGAFSLFQHDQLSFFYEKAYMPGISVGLVPADMGHIQYTKSIYFNRSK